MNLFCLSPSQVAERWEDFAPHFERFERVSGDMSAEQVRAAAVTSSMQLWGVQDAHGVKGMVATEICRTALGNLCVIRIACGGAEVGAQSKLLDAIGAWAQGLGCSRVRIYGRKGWLKRFPRFRPTGVIAEWRLNLQ